MKRITILQDHIARGVAEIGKSAEHTVNAPDLETALAVYHQIESRRLIENKIEWVRFIGAPIVWMDAAA